MLLAFENEPDPNLPTSKVCTYMHERFLSVLLVVQQWALKAAARVSTTLRYCCHVAMSFATYAHLRSLHSHNCLHHPYVQSPPLLSLCLYSKSFAYPSTAHAPYLPVAPRSRYRLTGSSKACPGVPPTHAIPLNSYRCFAGPENFRFNDYTRT